MKRTKVVKALYSAARALSARDNDDGVFVSFLISFDKDEFILDEENTDDYYERGYGPPDQAVKRYEAFMAISNKPQRYTRDVKDHVRVLFNLGIARAEKVLSALLGRHVKLEERDQEYNVDNDDRHTETYVWVGFPIKNLEEVERLLKFLGDRNAFTKALRLQYLVVDPDGVELHPNGYYVPSVSFANMNKWLREQQR